MSVVTMRLLNKTTQNYSILILQNLQVDPVLTNLWSNLNWFKYLIYIFSRGNSESTSDDDFVKKHFAI